MNALLSQFRQRDASVLFVTGAGISVASGIAPFRGSDPGAVWNQDVTEMGTFRFFQRDPVAQWSWYLDRFSKVRGALPNPAHLALVELEQRLHDMTIITQNIDGLHRAAGSKSVIEVHGKARYLRCSVRGCGEQFNVQGLVPWRDEMFEGFRASPSLSTVPRCEECNSILRPHVLWFDENYQSHDDYGLESVVRAANMMTCLVFIGTSFSVGITEMLYESGIEGEVPIFLIDPVPAPCMEGVTHYAAKAEEFLPELIRGI